MKISLIEDLYIGNLTNDTTEEEILALWDYMALHIYVRTAWREGNIQAPADLLGVYMFGCSNSLTKQFWSSMD